LRFVEQQEHRAGAPDPVVGVGTVQARLGHAPVVELLDALLRVTDQLLMVAVPDGLGGAGGGAGRLLVVDQTVVAQGAVLGGALVGILVLPTVPVGVGSVVSLTDY